jgi:hypothetical protein
MSRRITNKQEAENWLAYVEDEEKTNNPRSKHEFFIVIREEMEKEKKGEDISECTY